MLDRLLRIEEQFVRIEALLLVIFVLLMLSLATYNVFYGNVLVPIQVSLLTADEAEPVEQAPAGEPEAAPPTEEDDSADESDGFGGGFGGGFGDAPQAEEEGGFGGDFGDAPAEQPKPVPAESDGFGGDFGDDAPAAPPAEDKAEEPAAPADEEAGFGGDFDGGEAEAPPVDETEGFGGGFGGGFDDGAAPKTTPTEPATTSVEVDEAPKEIPFIARAIDVVKLEWIDVVLRQLVLIVGFLGAMLATRRRKHITIDALSKLLPDSALHWTAVVTNTISIVVCLLLAKAGSDLVAISIEFPKELTSWADEWQFQLAFPVGFGLLAFHFIIRLIESLYYATGKAEPPEDYVHGGGAV